MSGVGGLGGMLLLLLLLTSAGDVTEDDFSRSDPQVIGVVGFVHRVRPESGGVARRILCRAMRRRIGLLVGCGLRKAFLLCFCL